MNDAVRYQRASHVCWRRTLDTVVLLPVASSTDAEPFALAGTGPELWAVLAEPRTLDEMVDRLAQAHKVPRDRVAADVEPLLDRLLTLGAIAPARA